MLSRLLVLLALVLPAACSSDHSPAKPPVARQPRATRSTLPTPATAWAGKWELEDDFTGSTLTISHCRAGGFDFALDAYDGTHFGDYHGRATVHGTRATYQVAGNDEEGDGPCHLVFELRGDSLFVEQPVGICGGGAGVSYDGHYVNARKKTPRPALTLLRRGVFTDPADDAAMRRLVGPDYAAFAGTAQFVYEQADTTGVGTTLYNCSVPSMARVGSIILVGPNHQLWAGLVDTANRVLYYTNHPDYARQMPAILHAEFKDQEIVYKAAPARP